MLITAKEEKLYHVCKNTNFSIVISCSVSLIFATEILLGVYVYKSKSEIHNIYLKELRTETWKNEIRKLLSDREFCEMYGCVKKHTEVSITNPKNRIKRENGQCLELIDEGCLIKGEPGTPGLNGLNGQHGIPGVPGNSGPPGEKGVTGHIGPTRPKGDKGGPGLSGAPGPPGEPGASGPRGKKGVTGVRGPVGPNGDKGPYGTPGLPGLKGEQGSKGEPGEPGLPGEKGESGTPEAYDWRCLESKVIRKYNNQSYPGLPGRKAKCLITQVSNCTHEVDFLQTERILATSDDKVYDWDDFSRTTLYEKDINHGFEKAYNLQRKSGKVGHGSMVHGRSFFYYSIDRVQKILTVVKLDLSNNVTEELRIPRIHTEDFDYLFNENEDNPLEFKVDENGLWILVSIKKSGDVATVIKISSEKLEIEAVLNVDLNHKHFKGMFIASGILYGFVFEDSSSKLQNTFALDLYTCQLAQTSVDETNFQNVFSRRLTSRPIVYPTSMYYHKTKTLTVGNHNYGYWTCDLECF